VDFVQDTLEEKSMGTPDERAKQLSPRLRETLDCLLSGSSEKTIAKDLSLSPHTVHGYVKLIYRHFKVKSRAQLLSQWVRAIKLMAVAIYALSDGLPFAS
jgi:DNA-binding NarL/FixJ family response regulator